MAGKAAKGTLIKIGNGATVEVFNTLIGARNIDGPNESRDTIDLTNHSSANNYKEFGVTFKDGGEISFEILYDSSDTYHAQLITDYGTGVLRNFQIVQVDGGAETISVAAYITNISPSFPLEGALTYSCTLKVNGEPTRA